MKIGVCLKVTPDIENTAVKVLEGGAGIDVPGAKTVLNAYDEIALEEAIRTVEAHGGEVVVLSVGVDDASRVLRGALALGAARAVLVTDPTVVKSDSLAIARALAAVVRREGFDLVFCGRQATDDDNVQVPAMVAEILGWPQISFATKFATDGKKVTVTRRFSSAEQVVEASLPAVVTCEDALNTPRYAKLPAIMQAKKKPIDIRSAADLGLTPADVAPAVQVSSYALPPGRPKGRILTGDIDTQVNELVRLLREEAKVI